MRGEFREWFRGEEGEGEGRQMPNVTFVQVGTWWAMYEGNFRDVLDWRLDHALSALDALSSVPRRGGGVQGRGREGI